MSLSVGQCGAIEKPTDVPALMRQPPLQRRACLVRRKLRIAIEHVVDAGDRVPRNGPDLLAYAASIVKRRDAGMA